MTRNCWQATWNKTWRNSFIQPRRKKPQIKIRSIHMRLSILYMLPLLAVASVGIANADPVNLLANGDFSNATVRSCFLGICGSRHNATEATQFGSNRLEITGWTGSGLGFWEPDAAKAKSENPQGLFGHFYQMDDPPGDETAFVALEGDPLFSIQGNINQRLGNLNIGDAYNVAFDWGVGQAYPGSGLIGLKPTETYDHLEVSLGGTTQDTATLNNAAKGFTGWQHETFQFLADSASPLLNFFSSGGPVGAPPFAVLANVSVTRVPEPAALPLVLFGGVALGFGLITRYRAARRGERHEKE
jgi:hypothetical protein